MSISSDEINYLIYRYLQENGFTHTAFSFAYESLVTKSSVSQTEIPPGALITFLQKGLEYIGIEEHIAEDGSIKDFDRDYSLLSPFICDAVAVKEDRKPRKLASSSSNNDSNSEHIPMEEGDESNQLKDATQDSNLMSPQTSIAVRNEAGTKWMQLIGHQGEVFICAWNPQQLQLASGSADGMCRLWGLWDLKDTIQINPGAIVTVNQEQGLPIRTAVLPHMSFPGERYKDVTTVTWNPDGTLLATGCYDGLARIWDHQGYLKMTLKEHTGPVFSLKWNKTGDLLLSGSYDKRAIIWSAATGTILKVYALHSAPVLDVDWRDADVFATCSSDKTIYICSVSSSSPVAVNTFKAHKDEVNAICWSPCGNYVASCSDDCTAKIWNVDLSSTSSNVLVSDENSGSKGLKLDLKGHAKEIYTARWTLTGPGSPNPDKLLKLCTASFDGSVKIWSAENGDLLFTLRRQAQPVYSISPNPSGLLIATGSLGGYVSVFSLEDGSMVREIRGNGDTFDVSWSFDGSLLSCCFSSGALHVLETGV